MMTAEREESVAAAEGGTLLPGILYVLLACIVTCSAYYMFIVSTARVVIDVEVDQATSFSVYWAKKDGGYSEKDIATVQVHEGKSSYAFYLTNLSKVGRLRIDPHSYVGEVHLKRFEVTQEGYEPIIIGNDGGFDKLVPLNQIESTRVDEGGLWLRSTGTDPHLEILISPNKTGGNTVWLLARMLGIALLTAIVVYFVAPLVKNLQIVSVVLFGVWILIIVMAGISKTNVHPDEYVHLAATSYYADNWLPPVIEDPSIRNTYSVYGLSRLNNGEIYYLFSGKTYKLLQSIEVPRTFGCRFFNVALFGIIFFFSIRNFYARLAAIPLLVSSQVWYVFSYCNSDAFALFLAFVSTCLLIDPNSYLQKYLKGRGMCFQVGTLLLLGAFFGSVFTMKINYYPFIGLIFLILGIRILFTEEYYWEKKGALIRLVLLMVLAFGFFGLRTSADYAVNGLDKDEKIAVLQQELGEAKYKKSSPIEERGRTMYMKDRGVAFEELISEHYWDIRTLQSSFGVFGYMSIVSSKHFYTVAQWAGSALLMFILISSITWGGYWGAGVTLTTCCLSMLLILAAMHHCWVVDFQPQGRYLFPILSMFGIVLGHNIKALNKNVLVLLVGCMFMLGVYSFIFQGLLKIPRLPY